MIAIGIDVSKGKSTVAACKPFGEIVLGPLNVTHTSNDLKELAESIKSLNEECRIVLEHTGKYYQPIALLSGLPREGTVLSTADTSVPLVCALHQLCRICCVAILATPAPHF